MELAGWEYEKPTDDIRFTGREDLILMNIQILSLQMSGLTSLNQ